MVMTASVTTPPVQTELCAYVVQAVNADCPVRAGHVELVSGLGVAGYPLRIFPFLIEPMQKYGRFART
jgi:hypothetical protein